MSEILKFTLGFLGILLVGLVGLVASSLFKAGDSESTMGAIDNVSGIK